MGNSGECAKIISDERAIWLATEVMPHEPDIRAWLRRAKSSESDIDDTVQDAYAKLVCLSDISSIINVRAYFFRTARSAAIDRIRRQSVIAIDSVVHIDSLHIPDPISSPEEQVIGRNELKLLVKMVSSLPEKTRRIFLFSRVEGLPHKEIAKRTGVPESTVEKHVAKAFLLLMQSYASGGYGLEHRSRITNGRGARKLDVD